VTPHTRRRTRYAEWLTAQGLRFGFPVEVAARATQQRGSVENDTPPLELWHAMPPTLRLVELVRERFGPTIITSAYRAPAYNLAVGGARDSRHAHNDAVDFRCTTGTPREWAVLLRGLRDAGQFAGGIGVYASWVHVDTRGTNADWVG
jgi:uncharacterized protein YcbK (DUF882 family)